jgi:hypothetical protein
MLLSLLHVILNILGVVFIISLLSYILPQLIIAFSSEPNLLKRYGEGSWTFISGDNSGIGKEFALKLAKQVYLIFLI